MCVSMCELLHVCKGARGFVSHRVCVYGVASEYVLFMCMCDICQFERRWED